MNKYDVIVVGGGPSGAVAAIAAARNGANVLLAEKGNCLGGAAANCLVNPFMPYKTKIDGEIVKLSDGIFGEIVSKLKKFDMFEFTRKTGDSVFSEEYMKLILNRMAEEAGVNLLYHAHFIGATTANGAIKSAKFSTKGGILEFFADHFIDATGDADVAVSAGCPTRLGRDEDNLCQPMTLCFRMGNVDVASFLRNRSRVSELYNKFKQEGKIKNPREDVLVFKNMNDGVLHINSTRICKKNPVDPFDVTKAELEAREQVFELFFFLKENFKFCKDATLLMTALSIGVRESRMIDGEYILTGDDLKKCCRFDDAIAAGNYDIDIHNPEGSGTSHYYFKQGEYYQIPYRSLIAKNISNLLVAGRCASFDHEAQASCRIIPICATLGQAAGTAAAIATQDKTDIRSISIKKLQAALKKDKQFF